jgi:hypothetical protein
VRTQRARAQQEERCGTRRTRTRSMRGAQASCVSQRCCRIGPTCLRCLPVSRPLLSLGALAVSQIAPRQHVHASPAQHVTWAPRSSVLLAPQCFATHSSPGRSRNAGVGTVCEVRHGMRGPARYARYPPAARRPPPRPPAHAGGCPQEHRCSQRAGGGGEAVSRGARASVRRSGYRLLS